jgi:hypothetical protein
VARRFLRSLRELRLDHSKRPIFKGVAVRSDDSNALVGRIGIRVGDRDDSVTIGDRSIPLREYYRPFAFGGNHTERGVLVASGPPFRTAHRLVPADPEQVKEPPSSGALRVRDVTPTVLAAMGLTIPDSMDGRVMEEILDPSFRSGRDVRPGRIELDWQPFEPEGIESEERVPDAMVKMLRALGYAR